MFYGMLNLFFSGIRILVALLLDTLPMLGNVLAICTLIFVVFGIIGVQLWQGVLRNRCALQLPPNVTNGYVENLLCHSFMCTVFHFIFPPFS